MHRRLVQPLVNDVEGLASSRAGMAEITCRPVEGATTLFEIPRDGNSLGIVWRHHDEWFADKASISAPAVRAVTREDAVTNLLDSQRGPTGRKRETSLTSA